MRKNKITKIIARILLFILGRWTVYGILPAHGKYIIVSAPHEKRRETLLGYAVGEIQNAPRYRFFMKYQIKKIPIIGWFMMKIGMIPVVRTRKESEKLGVPKSDYVKIALDEFKNEPGSMVLAVAPEGTTEWKGFKNSPVWQKGFYAVAVQGGFPVVFLGFDHVSKKIYISGLFQMTGDIAKDKLMILEWYRCIPNYRPNIIESKFNI